MSDHDNLEFRNILVIRRDNIGDLVLTTPTISLLRRRYPNAHIAALVNSYNAPVLKNNPDLDEVFAYTKAKHLEAGQSRVAAWLAQWRLMRRLRARRFDLAIVATPAPTASWLRLASAVHARHTLAAVTNRQAAPPTVDLPVTVDASFAGRHAAEQTALLLRPLGIVAAPPAATLRADPTSVALAEAAWRDVKRPRIGLHLSARKPRQRWPRDRWPALMRALLEHCDCAFALFWSPGTEDDPRHPGDDGTAAAIRAAAADLPLTPMPTPTLETLIAGLATVDLLVCSDGGAMHLAAALGKPIVCFFGNSDPVVWRPWQVPYRLLRPASENVADLDVDSVVAAAVDLLAEAGKRSPA